MFDFDTLDNKIVNYVESLSVLNKKQLHVISKQETIDKLDPKTSDLPDFFKNYAYTLNPLPVFINDDIIKEMSACVASIPSLIHDLLRIHFNNNADKIADFYNLPLSDAKAMIDFDFNPHFFSRFDLMHSKQQFKILEINMGSKLGGWEIGAYDGLYRGTQHLTTMTSQGDKFTYRVSLQEFIVQLLQSCTSLRLSDENDIYRIVFLLDETSLGKYVDTQFVGQLFQGIAQAMGLTLEIFFPTDVKDLSFDSDYLYFQGKRVSAFNNGREEQKDDFDLAALNTIFFKNNLVQTDNPLCTMFQDKRNLALLCQLAHHESFSQEQKNLIKRFVPWGATIDFNQVEFEGESWDLKTLLEEKQDHMVIKQAYGRGQGQGVFVGRYLDKASWHQAIDVLFNEEGYFVQEFCEGHALLSNTDLEQSGVNPCDAVWGVFGFNKSFGGAGVRLVSKTLNDDGVINCAKGAQDTMVYETSV